MVLLSRWFPKFLREQQAVSSRVEGGRSCAQSSGTLVQDVLAPSPKTPVNLLPPILEPCSWNPLVWEFHQLRPVRAALCWSWISKTHTKSRLHQLRPGDTPAFHSFGVRAPYATCARADHMCPEVRGRKMPILICDSPGKAAHLASYVGTQQEVNLLSCFRQWEIYVFVGGWEMKGSKKISISNSVFANKYSSLCPLWSCRERLT